MLRAFYVILLRLHPKFFRHQFADEMLWIFDQSATTRREFSLFADALRSLATQWMFRSDSEQEPKLAGIAAPGADRVPVFYVSGSELPPPGALLNGLILAVGVFSLAGFALAHSGGHGRVYTYYSNDFHEGLPPRAAIPHRDSGQRCRPRSKRRVLPSQPASRQPATLEVIRRAKPLHLDQWPNLPRMQGTCPLPETPPSA